MEIKKEYENLISEKSKIEHLFSKKFKQLQPIWDYNWEKEFASNSRKIVVVPFSSISENKLRTKMEDGSHITFDNATFLVASKLENKYHFVVVTKIPDKRYLENDGNKNNPFTGLILFYDIFGKFDTGYKVGIDKTEMLLIFDKKENSNQKITPYKSTICIEWESFRISKTIQINDCIFDHSDCFILDKNDSKYNPEYGYIDILDKPLERKINLKTVKKKFTILPPLK
ncbi:MAG: hypothetical protein IPH28_05260 [Cytophagaceae bacterium]|nr:hypothetical protein [Cytophagaceae bacterium]MBK9508930.1 hypothetical protein [Cytophagaceae bacterium]MBK9935834.1 hypothetical protein [Cytophagaceae bacterium]MBL0325093.1 hypothetical protein [Cytophagaceae bacterium]